MDRAPRRRAGRRRVPAERRGPPADAVQGLRRRPRAGAAAHGPARGAGARRRGARGVGRRHAGGTRPRRGGPPALPLRRGHAHHRAGRGADAVPRGGLGGRAVPARALPRRAGRGGRLGPPGRRALVRPRGPRPGPRRATAGGRVARGRRHRGAVAQRLAVPRAGLPARLLGRGDDAEPAARTRRLRRSARTPAPRLPGRRGLGPRRGGRRARVAGGGGGPGRRRAGAAPHR